MSGRHTNMNFHVGQTFNYLTVKSLSIDHYIYKNKNIKKTFFNCECVCGNIKKIFASNVINGNIKSCGCKKKELIAKANDNFYGKNKQKSVEKRMFSEYKLHGKNFELNFEEFEILIHSKCHYCGDLPSHKRFNKNKKLSLCLNGIDRVDSNKGYVTDNCVACCTTCNYMKNTLDISTFIDHIFKIKNNLSLNERGRNS